MKKTTPHSGRAANNSAYKKANDNNSAAQRNRLLQALRNYPVSTLMARHKLDVMHPAARVQELRGKGYNIVTHKRDEYTPEGNRHCVAEYVLFSGKHKRGAA